MVNQGQSTIATDIVGRGIDIPEISFVIHYHIPKTHEIFIHRSGRTGRINRYGEVICLVTP